MNNPKVYLELREVYRDHLGLDDITAQLAVVECDSYRLWFTQNQLAAYVEQITTTSFALVWNSYVMVETFDHEAFFVRREGRNLWVVMPPDLDRHEYEWQPLRTAILEVLREE